jgi:hypothetical protein
MNNTDAIARPPNRSSGLRTALISALTASAPRRFQKSAGKFLLGLSTDELQYIADYLGACVLESLGSSSLSRRELAGGIAHFEQCRYAPAGRRTDHEHKMILLLEYLCRSRLTHCALAVRAGRT